MATEPGAGYTPGELMVSAAAGRQAVEEGQADCKTVEAAFGEIEQIVLQTPV